MLLALLLDNFNRGRLLHDYVGYPIGFTHFLVCLISRSYWRTLAMFSLNYFSLLAT